jgi:hypothetical protein
VRFAGRGRPGKRQTTAVGQYVGPFAESVAAFVHGLGFRFDERLTVADSEVGSG